LTVKRFPVPATFVVVVSAVIFLIIFFGAWAVSADADGQDRRLTFGFAGGVTPTSATTVNPTDATGEASLDQEAAGDSWWGSAFLRACPFH